MENLIDKASTTALTLKVYKGELPCIKYNFDAKKEKDAVIKSIREWFNNEGKCPDGYAVIGISGGKDSSIAAALCAEALGNNRVIGVLMPNGIQPDINDSYRVVNCLKIKYIEVNIKDAFDSLASQCDWLADDSEDDSNRISSMVNNLPPRLRMSVLYGIAQRNNGRVINTCNLSETMVGWETRWGDSVGDFAPLSSLTKTEVVEIGLLCNNLPSELVLKTPSDGLCGKTDEDELGFTYKDLDSLIRIGKCSSSEVEDKILRKVQYTEFKRKPIPSYSSNLFNFLT